MKIHEEDNEIHCHGRVHMKNMAAFTVVCQVAFTSLGLHSAIAQISKSGGIGDWKGWSSFSAKTEPRGSRNGPNSNGGQLCNLMLQ